MFEIRALRPNDDRTNFHSGNSDLDRFFSQFAGQNQFKHQIGTTYVAVEGEKIQGFATVSASYIEVENIPQQQRKKLPRYPLTVLRLARLAVDQSAQGKGVGKLLLQFVFNLARRMASMFGCVGVVVDAKPEALSFYEKLGFAHLKALEGALSARPIQQTLFLPINSIPP